MVKDNCTLIPDIYLRPLEVHLHDVRRCRLWTLRSLQGIWPSSVQYLHSRALVKCSSESTRNNSPDPPPVITATNPLTEKIASAFDGILICSRIEVFGPYTRHDVRSQKRFHITKQQHDFMHAHIRPHSSGVVHPGEPKLPLSEAQLYKLSPGNVCGEGKSTRQ